MPARLGVTGVPLTLVNGVITNTAVPSIVWTTTPTFVATGERFGAGALSGGVGSYAFNVPAPGSDGSITVSKGFWIKAAVASFTGTSDFFFIRDSAGVVYGVRRTGKTLSLNFSGSVYDLGYDISDGAWHFFKFIIVATGGGQNYSAAYLDGNGGSGNQQNGGGTHLHTGAAQVFIDATNQLAAGDLLDDAVFYNGDLGNPPTAEFVADAKTVFLFHFNGDGLNAASAAVTGPVLPKVDNTMTVAPDGTLSTPYITRSMPILALPTDGSQFDAQINAFQADCVNHGYNCGYLKPGLATIANSLTWVDGFDLVGLGRPENFTGGWGGGVKLVAPLNPSQPIISWAGSGGDGSSLSQLRQRPGLHNMAIGGPGVQWFKATAQRWPALIDLRNVYRARMTNVWAGADFQCGLRISNTWDSDLEIWVNNGGWSDPTTPATASFVKGYTGRDPLSIETTLGYSLGVGAIEIISPNTTGADISNNIRLKLMCESNPQNGSQILAWGGNTTAITVLPGSKLEATEGCAPLIALDSIHCFEYHGYLFAGATGAPYVVIGQAPDGTGGLPAGTAFSSKPVSGALVMAQGCVSPRIHGNGGYKQDSNAGQPDALFRFVGCEDPQYNFLIESGITRVKTAWAIRDACDLVSPYHTHLHAQRYIRGLTGANLTASSDINSTTAATT